ncbi:tRNA epoxyqueuosine(34) reductase QueG [Phreatobacter cathodiphilus]|uniref:Epoxyqueuosine reductase n=1 Tax=Phreatobacter cathodiphilus TaxID=1868589 RepID=A0A2S0NI68_9HYPH|nr:tRNA epoxyqueuosine(34) reductase QueG [Phreatobacter cathodiphilus]AVO47696.1 tRNA epoxyqueuosine(34) reductase QueG [Phreatobacter cathodiphilus]
MSDPAALRAAITAQARAEGFDAVGFTRPDAIAEAGPRLAEAVEAGRHGSMAWMAETLERRSHPNAMWPEGRSLVMLGVNYGPDENPLDGLTDRDRGLVSVYARGNDYHEVIKARLKALARWLVEETGCELKVFVDTAPLMEKPLAAAAGLGWQGKHTNLVSRDFGSWLFLGAVMTTLDIPPDTPERDHCGSCTACLSACPTDAFPRPYALDARRCISYLTIEHQGPIPREFRAAMGNRIYGCDDCLAVCPWNKFAETGRNMKLAAREHLKRPSLAELAQLDDAAFRALFTKSPVKRIGRDRFVRNVLIAIGNSGDPALAPVAADRLADPAAVVRGAAIWALRRLDPARVPARPPAGESDPDVLAEWRQSP